jgi:uncharacterized protein (TIGR02118 family)
VGAASDAPLTEERMISVCIMYPNTIGARFDAGYYVEKHMPMSIALLSAHPGFRGVSVERGVGGTVPGSDAPFVAMCHYRFESVADFIAAFTPHAAVLQADMAHYTDIEPIIQFNEVAIAR